MLYQLRRTQFIRTNLSELWQFISNPKNLTEITPASMKFEVLNPHLLEEHTYGGQLIEYSVRPLFGIKLYWLTEITHVTTGNYFVDEQRRGPYKLWQHQHILKEKDGGVEMTDIVHYQLPFGLLGSLAHAWFVRRKLEKIFDYRKMKMDELFNADKQTTEKLNNLKHLK